jgi:hypothetical protein
MRKPGQGAGEKYKSLRQSWLRRMRRRLAAISVGLFTLAAAANVLAVGAPRSWVWAAGCITGGFIVALMAMRNMPPSYIGNWQLGQWGEKSTARTLKPLLRIGWYAIHDLQHEHGNIDHVLIGPAGVFLLDSKWIEGEAEVYGDGLIVRRIEDPDLTYTNHQGLGVRMRGAAWDLNARIYERSRISQWVTAVVVIHGRFAAEPQTVQKVTYIGAERLVDFLQSQPDRLTPALVDRLATEVTGAFGARDEIEAGHRATGRRG